MELRLRDPVQDAARVVHVLLTIRDLRAADRVELAEIEPVHGLPRGEGLPHVLQAVLRVGTREEVRSRAEAQADRAADRLGLVDDVQPHPRQRKPVVHVGSAELIRSPLGLREVVVHVRVGIDERLELDGVVPVFFRG